MEAKWPSPMLSGGSVNQKEDHEFNRQADALAPDLH